MERVTIPTFVTTIPLKTDSHTQSILRRRFFAAQQQYNALLGEGLKRLRLMKADKCYKQACELYKQKRKKQANKALFKKLTAEHGYREYDLHAYTKQWNKKDKHWYKEKGKNIKGKRSKNHSKSLLKTQHELADIKRKQATHRKRQHGRLVNTILKIGNQIKTEKLSYKSFQKSFGKSVELHAPGMFIEKLKPKAENAGGYMEQ